MRQGKKKKCRRTSTKYLYDRRGYRDCYNKISKNLHEDTRDTTKGNETKREGGWGVNETEESLTFERTFHTTKFLS